MNRPLLSCGLEVERATPQLRADAARLAARCDKARAALADLALELNLPELELDVAPVCNAAAVLGAYAAALGFLTGREASHG